MSAGIYRQKGHGSAADLESKSSMFPNHSFHIDSDISSLYMSFEYSNARQSAHRILSLHCQCVYRIYYSTNPDCNCNCQAPEGKQEQEKTNEEYSMS